ncbi:MAG: TetR family transcriptional regulator [Clostridia bacterium]|nr:TetR family transcriptional regulator [Clostridia bacterium]
MPDSGITKKALAAAMKELMCEAPFSKISIGDICDKCSMNRKSFYYHFRDKYDLVNWIFYNEFVTAVQKREYDNGWEFLGHICRYFYENRYFYMNALMVEGQNSFRDYFREILKPLILGFLEEACSGSEDPVFFSMFFTDAILAAIMRWLLASPCMPPDEFVFLMKSSVEGIAKKIVDDIQSCK